jgi:hypothetical protein
MLIANGMEVGQPLAESLGQPRHDHSPAMRRGDNDGQRALLDEHEVGGFGRFVASDNRCIYHDKKGEKYGKAGHETSPA